MSLVWSGLLKFDLLQGRRQPSIFLRAFFGLSMNLRPWHPSKVPPLLQGSESEQISSFFAEIA